MAATDIYHITGGLKGRAATAFLGGNVDDYIQVDAFAAAQVAAGDTTGTITAWINPGAVGINTIFGTGDKNVVEFIELNIEYGKLVARCTDNTTAQWVVTSDDLIIEGPHQWVHVAVVQNGTAPILYVDGKRVAQTNSTATKLSAWFADTGGIDSGRIGAANKAGDDSVTQEFTGGISDVKYWDAALTDDQMEKDYRGLINTTDLISHWSFKINYTDSVSSYDGTAVGDIILSNNYSEFTSRFRNHPAAAVVVADSVEFSVDSNNNVGHAIIVKAA